MSIELKIPKTGMGIAEGTIQTWHKNEGDAISKSEVLVEIETAKAIEEIESPINGTLKKILLPEGESAEVETVIALLSEGG
jgi:pyruvate/2-oxoglutarate dehydrogenase complex dihydrolipoamide acyltransferase (E2) component